MENAQLFLDEIVTLVQAERGFVVLHDPSTGLFRYEATNNFEPDQNRYPDQMFVDLLAEAQPQLTTNGIAHNYLPPGIISTLGLRTVLVVPLKKEATAYGLLWCDRRLNLGAFQREDLEQATGLVDQFLGRG